MTQISRNFILGRMNKSLDERLVPNGEYVDAMNIRVGATNDSEEGAVEKELGNLQLTQIEFDGTPLSNLARCIGAYEDGANETIYWFIHDQTFPDGATGKLDMIVSFDTRTNSSIYHVIAIDDGGGVNTTLNFDPSYLITGVDLIGDQLYFTDDYNPPRVINIERNYPNPISDIDQTSAESLLVIKKPPINSPSLNPVLTASQENFLEDRFICFATRYRYEDGEYSATSQFSNPSFIPSSFDYSIDTGLNEGMLNSTNMCEITYNSGGPLVTGVDLLFRDMNTGLIKIIERLDKSELGLADDTEYTYTFSNSKIFTVLPESEILRLYDNVPLFAKAQTFMGNRLIYGNYKEGYDLTDLNGIPTMFEYTTSLQSGEVGEEALDTRTDSSDYTIAGAATINDSAFYIDLDGVNLVQGASIDLSIRFEHDSFSAGTPPVDTTPETTVNFIYTLPQDFDSVYDLATSTDFIEKIGTAANIQTVPNSCDGVTLTDLVNCSLPATLNAYAKTESGIDAAGEPILIITSPGSTEIGFQMIAMHYDDGGGNDVYEYYDVTFVGSDYLEIGNPTSLHSNRGYEIGIMYMDEFNRATTALVSENNTTFVPCSVSDLQNKIRVNIPVNQIAPSWATRYKFCIKADKENYFNVFSQFFFRDPTSGADFFLLEGQNTRKVEEGDELFVKRDTGGATNSCILTTVLEKKAQEADFLNPAPVDSEGNDISVPAGTYMKLRANNFATDVGDLPIVAPGTKSKTETGGTCGEVLYPVNIEDPANPGTYIDYTIPAGSRITLEFKSERIGKDCIWGNELNHHAVYEFIITLTASQDYANFKDWWDGDNVGLLINNQAVTEQECVPPDNPIWAAYDDDELLTSLAEGPDDVPCSSSTTGGLANIHYQFWYDDGGGTGEKWLVFHGLWGENSNKKKSKTSVNIQVIRSDNLCVFETLPDDALPDVWYESSQSYAIDTATGYHEGNVQDQTAGLPAIIDTAFFNCIAFGNGVESYQIKDSMIGKSLFLGNRVTTTSAKEYMESHRFADLTYSGVFNDESNVNKLNEFNLGLLNFKPLEDTYGPIMKLFGRETDILTLQEDKISYVLAGKNILSDSTGGSVVTSVPEVLGTQIARVEEYGISHNPESFASWGSEKYFTDAKRGSVILLNGSNYQNEQLDVVSNRGMTPWFRDLFIDAFDTQKLGGYDPYHKEYVLSSNNIAIPTTEECLECGVTKTWLIDYRTQTDFCVDVGLLVGDVDIVYNVISVLPGTFEIEATYNSTTVTTGQTQVSGTLTVDKDTVAVSTIDISLTGQTNDSVVEITVNCPDANEITIFQICVSNNIEAGQFIHNEYRWTDGTYVSPLHSNQVQLASGTENPLVSQYSSVTGPQGAGIIPANGADISIRSTRYAPIDDFQFQIPIDKFMYLRTSILYDNTEADITTLLGLANAVNPTNDNDPTYDGNFNMPGGSTQYLYLIYDYRNANMKEFCYSNTSVDDACCNCTAGANFLVEQCRADGVVVQVICSDTLGAQVGDFVEINPDGHLGTCIYRVIATDSGAATAAISALRPDILDCSQVCNTYDIENVSGNTLTMDYLNCSGVPQELVFTPGQTWSSVCSSYFTPEDLASGDYVFTFVYCDCLL